MNKFLKFGLLIIVVALVIACGGSSAAPTAAPGQPTTPPEPKDDFGKDLAMLVSHGVISSSEGKVRKLSSLNETTNLLDNYDWYNIDSSPTNFVIRTVLNYETADANGDLYNSGCGFVFRYTDENNHYAVFHALDGSAQMWSFQNNEYTEESEGSFEKPAVPKGSAVLLLVANGDAFNFYVNGEQVIQKVDSKFADGTMAYSLMTGTDKDFGQRCNFTNTQLLELP